MANVKLGTKAVGSIVKIKVNGASKDFIVVQQGNPNTSTYDSSCNGTWLLMKDIYTTSTFGNNNSYKDSSIHTYLNGTFYNLIDSNIRAAIKQVKIPYQNGTGSGGSLATGSNGLSTKVFLLSGYEVGWTTSDNGYFPKDGVRLAYFGNSSSGNSKRIAYNGSSAAIWWLRSPLTGNNDNVWDVGTGGSGNLNWCSSSYGVRPAFILPSTLVVSDDGTVSPSSRRAWIEIASAWSAANPARAATSKPSPAHSSKEDSHHDSVEKGQSAHPAGEGSRSQEAAGARTVARPCG